MNKLSFSINNVKDKVTKSLKSRKVFASYLRAYVLNRFKDIQPDAYFTSYPKCGRTWLRYMLKTYLGMIGENPEKMRVPFYVNYGEDKIIRFEHGKGDWVPAPFSIEQQTFDSEKYEGKKIIFLVRHPGDVIVSSFYHLKFRDKIYKGELSEFIRHPLVGIEKIIAFMNMMVTNQDTVKDFLLLFYEDLHKDPYKQFMKVLTLLEIPQDKEKIKKIIEESRFNKMKKKEKAGEFNEPWLKSGNKGSDNSMKVRKGKIGGYLEELNKEDIEYIEKVIKEQLDPEILSHYK
jgi:hypothetical protein